MVDMPPRTPTLVPALAEGVLVVVVGDSEESSRRIENHFRNAGHAIRTVWVSDLEELDDILRRGTPDLLLCSTQLPDMPLQDVCEMGSKLAPDLPILGLGPDVTLAEIVTSIRAGARDLVSDMDVRFLQHLECVCLREIEQHHMRRELRTTRLRLTDFEARHLQLLAGTADAVSHIQEGIVSHTNPAFAQLLGFASEKDLIGIPLMDLVAADHQPKVKEHLRLLNKGRADGKPLECGLMHADGHRVLVKAQLTRGIVDGENFIEMLIRSDAPSAEPSAAAAAAPTSDADSASGRLSVYQAMATPSQKWTGNRMALLIAIDDAHGLEERVGFEDAELITVEVGKSIRERLDTATDSLFRFSTNEFVALIGRATHADGEKVVEKLCKELAAQIFSVRNHEAHITVSIAASPVTGAAPPSNVINDIVREARKLSEKGGNKFAVIGASAAGGEVREDATKAANLRKAIEENRLKLAYQSIASLEGDTRHHFDVLVRMIDNDGNEQHAAEFIPIAEQYGLIRAIDRWVVARAMKVLAKRDGTRDTSMLFVKISEETLKDAEGFLAWLNELLKVRPLKNSEICFEFQELVIQNHIRKGRALTKAMRDFGASVAIEHYGIGSSSAQLLEHIPANFLKFHRSFTQNFADKEIQKKMTMLMELAKQRSIKTIVSHVEDANIMARMWQMGVNYIQGYHVQEPEVVLLSADPVR